MAWMWNVRFQVVYVELRTAARLRRWKKCQIHLAPSAKHAVRKRSSCLQVVLIFSVNIADFTESKRCLY